mgnify:CR=1 FL=1
MSSTDTVADTVRWPTGTEYSASVQQPSTSFSDTELQQGQLTLTPLGIPASASGQSAIAFHMEGPDGPLAVRCLLNAHDDGRIRYTALHDHVESYDVPSVVPARWLDEGVRANGRWWPVVVMPWVSGAPLHIALEERLDEPERLSELADRWLDLVETLQDKDFAHGDLQHGNVLLDDDDEFKMVDLDGVWVPDMGCGAPNEYGHPNYQHVNRSETDWGPHVDTFSALVIALSMLALAADSGFARFMTGENLLFVKSDFADPDGAEVWRALLTSSDAEVADLAQRVQTLARQGRMPTMTVREVLDASFDVSAVPPVTPEPVPSSATGVLPTVSTDGWWNQASTAVVPPGGGPPGPASPVSTSPASATPAAAQNAAPLQPTTTSHWSDSVPIDIASSQPDAPGAPGLAASIPVAQRAAPQPHQPPPPAQVQPAPPGQPAGVVTPAMARAAAPTATGLARFTGQPVIAGLVSGALAGLAGSLIAGVLQDTMDNPRAAGGIFVGLISAMLGGLVHAWPALNLSNFALAGRRFVLGAAAGVGAGIAAVLAADAMTKAALEPGDTGNALLVAYIWALTAALVGLVVGWLRSPNAGAYAFSGGAVAGVAGGLFHGAWEAEFENRALLVDGFDGGVLLIASFVAMLIGVFVSVAIRTARAGSLTVIEGPGAGTVFDFHTEKVTIGSSTSDTLVVNGRDLPERAVVLMVGEHHAEGTTQVAIQLDGAPPARSSASTSDPRPAREASHELVSSRVCDRGVGRRLRDHARRHGRGRRRLRDRVARSGVRRSERRVRPGRHHR